MGKWEMVRLGDVGTFQTGGTPSRAREDYFSGIHPWVSTPALGATYIDASNANALLTDEAIHNSATKIIPAYSLLIGIRVGVGKASINTVEMCTNQDIVSISNIEQSKISIEYLHKFLATQQNYFDSQKRGATIQGINSETLKNILIPLPPLATQQKIADILDRANALIEKRKAQIEKLDLLVKSQFVEMFGDPVTNPRGWDVGLLAQYCNVKGGKRVPKGTPFAKEKTNHPYLRVTDMKNATIIDDEIKYITDSVYEQLKRYTISCEDVYLTNVGVNLGMAGIIPQKYDKANLTENAVKLVFDKNVLNNNYLAFYLNTTYAQRYILERKMTVGVPKLAIFRIEELPIVVPPLPLQTQFAAFVERVEAQKAQLKKSLALLELNYKSLMQKCFNGEITFNL